MTTKPQTQGASHLQTTGRDKVLDLMKQTEQAFEDAGLANAGPRDDAVTKQLAEEAGIPTSDEVSSEEMAMLFEDYMPSDGDYGDPDDLNETAPTQPDPTRSAPNSSAQPAVPEKEIFGTVEDWSDTDDDINND